MRLSERLEALIAQAARDLNGRTVADVGTDHGFVPIRLVESGAASYGIAMDVRKGPLERAKAHIAERGLTGKLETRLSDGLAGLRPGEADTVVIAGMGGELMLRILTEGEHVRGSVRRWILSPQSELARFRHGLEELGLAITEETMVEEDGKFYVILTAEPGQMHYDEEFRYRYGDRLIEQRSPELSRLLLREEEQYRELIRRLSRAGSPAARERLEALQEELRQTEEARHAMQGLD